MNRTSWPPWTATAPTVVAEALAAVPRAPIPRLRPGPPAAAERVAAALAAMLAPEEAPVAAPAELTDRQRQAVRRAIAALRRSRGALLADPVGSGKTWVALAVARLLHADRTVDVLAPAALRHQWCRVARRMGVAVRVTSHEQASRGRLPGRPAPLVVIDESHRFRNPDTRRYAAVAPWLVGRQALLVSATPVVNRLDDLAHQLLLAVRDDALLADGVPSLRAALAAGAAPAALGRLIVTSDPVGTTGMARTHRTVPPAVPTPAWQALVDGIDRLTLSRDAAVSTLVRSVLWRAVGSSPAAAAGALARYRALLCHARDATSAGRCPGRRLIRAITGDDLAQVVMWPLLATTHPAEADPEELAVTDLDALDPLVGLARHLASDPDPKAQALADLLADGRPTLVFACLRDTVLYLRDRLASPRVAWCTGERAGIGPSPLPRESVLGWFDPAVRPPVPVTPDGAGINVLLATDVAAEGLDLQRAGRVVHYDLPWTPVRMEQRVGRSDRMGAPHREVQVVSFALPAALEARLRQAEALLRKAELPARAGLGAAGEHRWAWRARVARRWAGVAPEQGVATVAAGPPGVLAGVELECHGMPQPLRVPLLLWRADGGQWTDDPRIVGPQLEILRGALPDPRPAASCPPDLLGALADEVARQVGRLARSRWDAPRPAEPARRLLGRLRRLARAAARERAGDRLRTLDRAMRFAAAGHTAGEQVLIARLLGLADGALARAIARLPPPSPAPGPPVARLVGLVHFAGPAGVVRSADADLPDHPVRP